MSDKKPDTPTAWLEQAHILTEALPFMQRYENKLIVVKLGGHAMSNADLTAQFARDIVLLKQSGIHPVIVHGGGPQIGAMLERLGIESEFADGLRITDAQTIEVVEMVLTGLINKQIVSAMNQAGGRAIGLSGKDADLIRAQKSRRTKRDPDSNIEKLIDLGFVGTPTQINAEFLGDIAHADIIPVIAPVASDDKGQSLNINADTAAGAIAAAVGAARLLLLTDVAGVLDTDGALLTKLSIPDARDLIDKGIVAGGMIPKLETCIGAIEMGVNASVILDGRVPHAVLLELFTALGAGSLISQAGSP